MEGLIKFLVSDDMAAIKLRDKFVFKIVPMLNPDGVIVGNYRCSLAAVDLNRQWAVPSNKYHPEIYATKTMIVKTLDSR
jgi:murein tripeptide amidase MpaA